MLELTVTSRAPVLGQLMLLEGEGEVQMNGAYMVVYAVTGQQLSTGSREWMLTADLDKAVVNKDCPDCHTLNVQLVLQVGVVVGIKLDVK